MSLTACAVSPAKWRVTFRPSCRSGWEGARPVGPAGPRASAQRFLQSVFSRQQGGPPRKTPSTVHAFTLTAARSELAQRRESSTTPAWDTGGPCEVAAQAPSRCQPLGAARPAGQGPAATGKRVFLGAGAQGWTHPAVRHSCPEARVEEARPRAALGCVVCTLRSPSGLLFAAPRASAGPGGQPLTLRTVRSGSHVVRHGELPDVVNTPAGLFTRSWNQGPASPPASATQRRACPCERPSRPRASECSRVKPAGAALLPERSWGGCGPDPGASPGLGRGQPLLKGADCAQAVGGCLANAVAAPSPPPATISARCFSDVAIHILIEEGQGLVRTAHGPRPPCGSGSHPGRADGPSVSAHRPLQTARRPGASASQRRPGELLWSATRASGHERAVLGAGTPRPPALTRLFGSRVTSLRACGLGAVSLPVKPGASHALSDLRGRVLMVAAGGTRS